MHKGRNSGVILGTRNSLDHTWSISFIRHSFFTLFFCLEPDSREILLQDQEREQYGMVRKLESRVLSVLGVALGVVTGATGTGTV